MSSNTSKVAAITGASGGIGAALPIFRRQGHGAQAMVPGVRILRVFCFRNGCAECRFRER